MKVVVQIAAMICGRSINEDMELEVGKRANVKDLIKAVDKSGRLDVKIARTVLKGAPTILLNGNRLDPPEGFKHRLQEGDKVSVLLPLAGG